MENPKVIRSMQLCLLLTTRGSPVPVLLIHTVYVQSSLD